MLWVSFFMSCRRACRSDRVIADIATFFELWIADGLGVESELEVDKQSFFLFTLGVDTDIRTCVYVLLFELENFDFAVNYKRTGGRI